MSQDVAVGHHGKVVVLARRVAQLMLHWKSPSQLNRSRMPPVPPACADFSGPNQVAVGHQIRHESSLVGAFPLVDLFSAVVDEVRRGQRGHRTEGTHRTIARSGKAPTLVEVWACMFLATNNAAQSEVVRVKNLGVMSSQA